MDGTDETTYFNGNGEPLPWEAEKAAQKKCHSCHKILTSESLNEYFCSETCRDAYYPEQTSQKGRSYDPEYIRKRISQWREEHRQKAA